MSVPAEFAEGLVCFRHGKYYEAHEHWEIIWLSASGPTRLILQSLILIAGAAVHLQKNKRSPSLRLCDLARIRLLASGLDEIHGIHSLKMQEAIASLELGEFPQL